MTSQLAKELMDDLLQEEANPTEFFATSRLDEESDWSEDEPECPLMGTDLCEYAQVYQEDKGYVQWIRSHITTKSCAGMKKLRLYIECVDTAKKERLQAKWQEKKEMMQQKKAGAQMPIMPQIEKNKGKKSSKAKGSAKGSAEVNEEAIQQATELILAGMNHVVNPRTRVREGGGRIQQPQGEHGMDQEEDWNSEFTSDWEAVAANAQAKSLPSKSK